MGSPGTIKCRFDVLGYWNLWYDKHKHYIWSAQAGYMLHKNQQQIVKWLRPIRFWPNCLVVEFAGDPKGEIPDALMEELKGLLKLTMPDLSVEVEQDDTATVDTALSAVVPFDLPNDVWSALDKIVDTTDAAQLRHISLKQLKGVEWLAVGLCAEKIIPIILPSNSNSLLDWICNLLVGAGPHVAHAFVQHACRCANVAAPEFAQVPATVVGLMRMLFEIPSTRIRLSPFNVSGAGEPRLGTPAVNFPVFPPWPAHPSLMSSGREVNTGESKQRMRPLQQDEPFTMQAPSRHRDASLAKLRLYFDALKDVNNTLCKLPDNAQVAQTAEMLRKLIEQESEFK